LRKGQKKDVSHGKNGGTMHRSWDLEIFKDYKCEPRRNLDDSQTTIYNTKLIRAIEKG